MAAAEGEKQLIHFFQAGQSLDTGQGEMIYQSQTPQAAVFYILAGYVKSYIISPEGNANTLTLYGPGSIFPLGPSLSSDSRAVSYRLRSIVYFETLTKTQAYSRPQPDFIGFIDSHEDRDLHRSLNRRLIDNYGFYLARLEVAQYKYAYHRLVYQLLMLADYFGSEIRNGQVVIEVPLTHQEMADSLGLARETISRELEKLRLKDLIIKKDGHLIITDIKHLRLELEAA